MLTEEERGFNNLSFIIFLCHICNNSIFTLFTTYWWRRFADSEPRKSFYRASKPKLSPHKYYYYFGQGRFSRNITGAGARRICDWRWGAFSILVKEQGVSRSSLGKYLKAFTAHSEAFPLWKQHKVFFFLVLGLCMLLASKSLIIICFKNQ